MKLKILHIVQFLGVGGLEKVLFLLINEQIQDGHEVELFVYDYEQSWVEYFSSHGIKVETSFKKGPGYDRKLLSFVSRKVKNFDVIHTHDLSPLMYVTPVKFLHTLTFRKFPKLIHTTHGMDHIHRKPIYKWYEKLCSYQIDIIVGVSRAVCDYYKKIGVNHKKIVNINNGTPVHEISETDVVKARTELRRELALAETTPVWVSVARILPLKNQLLICEAAKLFPAIVFVLVGPSGDDSYWSNIKQNLPPNVKMLGSRSDITQILLGADFFISASKHEGIPVSVLEAGAVKLPCLLSDIAGHKLIQEGSDQDIALFFELGSLEKLKEAIITLDSDKSLARTMGSALHHHVKTNFSSTTMYEHYLQVYLGEKCFRS
jgi:glycosyltransferase involved in cell wall biosynthesis